MASAVSVLVCSLMKIDWKFFDEKIRWWLIWILLFDLHFFIKLKCFWFFVKMFTLTNLLSASVILSCSVLWGSVKLDYSNCRKEALEAVVSRSCCCHSVVLCCAAADTSAGSRGVRVSEATGLRDEVWREARTQATDTWRDHTVAGQLNVIDSCQQYVCLSVCLSVSTVCMSAR